MSKLETFCKNREYPDHEDDLADLEQRYNALVKAEKQRLWEDEGEDSAYDFFECMVIAPTFFQKLAKAEFVAGDYDEFIKSIREAVDERYQEQAEETIRRGK